ncbi:hypothetical protein [Jeotgalibaca porci]|uniref:hypothetical protein n=1 Tax=Jeotgalibaca porci TaxID=1868793 RepID=UPI0035A06953
MNANMKDTPFYERLLMAQIYLKAPKEQKNDFGGYAFRLCKGDCYIAKHLQSRRKRSRNRFCKREFEQEGYGRQSNHW